MKKMLWQFLGTAVLMIGVFENSFVLKLSSVLTLAMMSYAGVFSVNTTDGKKHI